MIVIDSSGWLEYITKGKNASVFADPILKKADEIIVPTICIYEVFKKILIEKGEELALKITAQFKKYKIIALDENIAMAAAKISAMEKIPMADGIVYATAQLLNATTWTQDKDFKELPNVKYVPRI